MSSESENAKEESKAVVLTEDRQKQLALMNSFGRRESTSSAIVGKQLKFKKGEWVAGPRNSETPVPVGTKLVFNPDWQTIGWQYWEDGKVVDAEMGRVIDAYQKKPRGMLSLPNKEDWPLDDQGGRKDPWQYANIALFKEPGKRGQVYTFATASTGGISAMGRLMKETSEGMRVRGEMFPVVVIGVSGYKHKKYGWVDTPAFKIIGWVPTSDFDVPLIPANADDQEADFGSYEADFGEAEQKPAAKPQAKKATSKSKAKASNGKREVSYE
jgi:hypothetical protein